MRHLPSDIRITGPSHGKCGYCHGSRGSRSSHTFGFLATRLSVTGYQQLIDRGWRRSGRYLYHPHPATSCCKLYTIRLNVTQYQLTHGQRKVLKRAHRWTESTLAAAASADATAAMTTPSSAATAAAVHVETLPGALPLDRDAFATPTTDHHPGPDDLLAASTVSTPGPPSAAADGYPAGAARCVSARRTLRPPEGAARPARPSAASPPLDWTRPMCAISAQMEDPRVWRTELVPTAFAEDAYALYRSYQIGVHGDDPDRITREQYRQFLVDSPLVPLEASRAALMAQQRAEARRQRRAAMQDEHPWRADEIQAAQEDLEEEADQDAEGGASLPARHPEHGYGSFHLRYYLNGQLVAVSVLDILPRSVSSVYFFYDLAHKHLGLGHYSALHEIGWTQRLYQRRYPHAPPIVPGDGTLAPQSTTPLAGANAADPSFAAVVRQHGGQTSLTGFGIRYYYLGYYIHDCAKMRYKGSYQPSELLCPVTQTWWPLSDHDRVGRVLAQQRRPLHVPSSPSAPSASIAASATRAAIGSTTAPPAPAPASMTATPTALASASAASVTTTASHRAATAAVRLAPAAVPRPPYMQTPDVRRVGMVALYVRPNTVLMLEQVSQPVHDAIAAQRRAPRAAGPVAVASWGLPSPYERWVTELGRSAGWDFVLDCSIGVMAGLADDSGSGSDCDSDEDVEDAEEDATWDEEASGAMSETSAMPADPVNTATAAA